MAEKFIRPILTYADEFHHAVTDQYQRIVNYFKPQFMLGLTTTPERMDGKSIYEICDYNVPYEITLKEAINKGALVPFHYYGIYDETDYSTLKLVKGRYNENDLNDKYIGNVKRYDLIYKYYKKYHSKRALGFCSSRMHVEEMAKEFCRRGVKSVAMYSNADGEFSEERNVAIEQLKNQEIKVIFSVDMFNEGVDFDMRLIDLFREMDKKSLSIKEKIKQEYYRVKELLDGKVPTRMELFTNMDDHIYEYCMKHSKENPFKRYMDFLYEIHELSDEEVVESWKRFFDRGTNWKDFPQVTSYEEYRKITDKQHLSKAKSMPIKFLKASGKGFFIDKDGYAMGIRDELADIIKIDAFKKQMKDIIEYRTMEYYRRRYVEK